MAQKIYKQGAFLIIEDTTNGTLTELNSSSVQIKKEKTNVDSYNIIDGNGQSVLKVNLADIVNANGDAYIENDFNTFRFEQVGAQNTTDVSVVKPKVYKALLTQTGTDAPTAIVLENTIGDITWVRSTVGGYQATSDDLFTYEKTFAISTPCNVLSLSVINIDVSINSIVLAVADLETGALQDQSLSLTPILIAVYP